MPTPITSSTAHDHGFTLRRRTDRLPWAIATIASIVALVLGVVVLRGLSPAAASSSASGEVSRPLRVHYEPAMAGEERVLEYVANEIAPLHGVEIEPVAIEDSVQANRAVATGEVDATIFEHQWYMKQVADGNGFDLTPTTELYQWAFGLYSSRYQSLDEIPSGAVVAVPTDLANQGQALWLLQREGLIELDPAIEPRTARLKDVVANPRGFDFKEIDLLTMPRTLDSVDLAIGYTNLFDAGKVSRDKGILFPEPPRSFASRLVVATGAVDSAATRKLQEVFEDPKFKEYLEQTEDPLVAGVLTPVSED